jgi:hypothetical protein
MYIFSDTNLENLAMGRIQDYFKFIEPFKGIPYFNRIVIRKNVYRLIEELHM